MLDQSMLGKVASEGIKKTLDKMIEVEENVQVATKHKIYDLEHELEDLKTDYYECKYKNVYLEQNVKNMNDVSILMDISFKKNLEIVV